MEHEEQTTKDCFDYQDQYFEYTIISGTLFGIFLIYAIRTLKFYNQDSQHVLIVRRIIKTNVFFQALGFLSALFMWLITD